jgi:hypothetical protein
MSTWRMEECRRRSRSSVGSCLARKRARSGMGVGYDFAVAGAMTRRFHPQVLAIAEVPEVSVILRRHCNEQINQIF